MLKVNMISESEFTIRGHGVHTAFEEMTDALRSQPQVDIIVNKFRRPADITHLHTFGSYSLLQLLFGPGKKVVSVHLVPDSLIGSIAGAEYFYGLAKFYMKLFYSRADLLLPVSAMVDETLRSQLGIKKPSKILYNTVDMSMYVTTPKDKSAARLACGVGEKTQVVVSCAQIQPRKRFDLFCKVAKALPGTTFVWIGGIPFKHFGAEYSQMQKLLDAKPKNVTVTGVIDHSEVKKYLQAADVFFLPSEQENHPMAVLEAAGVGLPIVVRDIPEYDDTFKNDVIRGRDDTFADIITRLGSDAAFYKSGVRGAKDIAARFDSKAYGAHLVRLYQELLAQE